MKNFKMQHPIRRILGRLILEIDMFRNYARLHPFTTIEDCFWKFPQIVKSAAENKKMAARLGPITKDIRAINLQKAAKEIASWKLRD